MECSNEWGNVCTWARGNSFKQCLSSIANTSILYRQGDENWRGQWVWTQSSTFAPVGELVCSHPMPHWAPLLTGNNVYGLAVAFTICCPLLQQYGRGVEEAIHWRGKVMGDVRFLQLGPCLVHQSAHWRVFSSWRKLKATSTTEIRVVQR